MSPVLNCNPSGPVPESRPNGSEGRSPPDTGNPARSNNVGDSTESENSFCEETRTEAEAEEDSKGSGPTSNNNNNVIPLNFKKSPSPIESISFEHPVRPWNPSPNSESAERDPSVSPSNSSLRRRNSVSPDFSPDASRASSETANESAGLVFPDGPRSLKMRPAEIPYEVAPFPFHENRRLSSDGFRMSNSFAGDPINPYFRLTGHSLNPFQPSPEFLGNPFLGGSDPKLFLNGDPGLGLITQQLHHLNGLATNPNKIPPTDLQRMSMQQLQFLQSHLQSLQPMSLLQPSPYPKFPDPKSQLSMLIQARKHPKLAESNSEHVRNKDVFPSVPGKAEDSIKLKDDRKINRSIEFFAKGSRKVSSDEDMEVDNGEGNDSDSDELLSVGSASPPPAKCPARTDPAEGRHSDASLSGSNCSSSRFPNRTPNNPNGSKKYSDSDSPVGGLQDGLTDTKTANASNRTLKFSIDNILKSDFGSEELSIVNGKEPKRIEPGKQKESERTSGGKKKPETAERERPVDLSSENNGANPTVPGTETPMLWPAWVYCTRYSDRPSSGPRTRRTKNKEKNPEEKRPRTAFSGDQLSKLKHEFAENRYLTERRRQDLARELGLNESQIKIWFQNKRAKMKKARGEKNPLALQLMAQGLYNHSTIPLTKEEEEAVAAEMSD